MLHVGDFCLGCSCSMDTLGSPGSSSQCVQRQNSPTLPAASPTCAQPCALPSRSTVYTLTRALHHPLCRDWLMGAVVRDGSSPLTTLRFFVE